MKDRDRDQPPKGSREPLLSVQDLQVSFTTGDQTVRAARKMSYSVDRGETLAIVGESGSGKSVSALAIMGLLPGGSTSVTFGSITLNGRELLTLSDWDLRRVRGGQIGMIFQDPLSSLNPLMRVGDQVAQGLGFHLGLTGRAARERVLELLNLVGITDAKRRIDDYPHQFSGGMRQRVMIAMAISCDPTLLIADEPTTALDVTIQAQVLELLQRLTSEMGTALVLITHDLGITAGYADRIAVAYAGRVVETGPARDLLSSPRHPYTRGLIASLPRIDRPRSDRLQPIQGAPPDASAQWEGCAFRERCRFAVERCVSEDPPLLELTNERSSACWEWARLEPSAPRRAPATSIKPILAPATSREVRPPIGTSNAPFLTVRDLKVWFPIKSPLLRRQAGWIRAVDGVSLEIPRGATLGLVGESGSGKSTTARAIMRLLEPTDGSIDLDGVDLGQLEGKSLRDARRRFQMIFQDPFSSIDPRQAVGDVVAEPLRVHGILRERGGLDSVSDLLASVGLDGSFMRRHAHELSGGQRQRVGIARALALQPDLIVCDEPVTALDVSVQAQVLNVLEGLKTSLDLTYLFIAHDLAVVRHIADRIAVMYLGRIVETGPVNDVFARPLHPYTAALLSAAPLADVEQERNRERIIVKGEIPSPEDPPVGCNFSTRCWLRDQLGNPEECATSDPALILKDSGGDLRGAACHFSDEMVKQGGSDRSDAV